MNKKIAILFAEGFEEIEAVTPVDILRRLEFDVVMAGDSRTVSGSHGMELKMDCLISDLSVSELDAVVLPGGLPGATNLREDKTVIELIRSLFDAGKVVAALCAAPIVLAKAGVLNRKTCTGYPMPMLREALTDANYTSGRVETDGKIVTGKGPGAAAEFAFAVASALGVESQARQLAKMMFVDWK